MGFSGFAYISCWCFFFFIIIIVISSAEVIRVWLSRGCQEKAAQAQQLGAEMGVVDVAAALRSLAAGFADLPSQVTC